MTGIRVLDIRVQFLPGQPVGSARRFGIYHDLQSGRTIDGDIIQAVLNFRSSPPGAGDPKKEIIILDFHEFKNFTAAAHDELQALIKRRLEGIIIPPWMSAMTIAQIWEYKNPAIVIAYKDDARDPLFWPGVNQRWIGEYAPSTDKLKSFMDDVATEVKPYNELRSIQCAKYNKVVFTPDDFSDKIRAWFSSTDQNSYIQKFFIINTDWSLRQRLIDNCVHASGQKLKRLAPYADVTVPQGDSYTLPSGNRALIVRLSNGHWATKLNLPLSAPEQGTLLIQNSATYSTELITYATDIPFNSILLNTNEMILLTAVNEGRAWHICAPTYLAKQGESVIPTPGLYEKLIHYQLAKDHWVENITLPQKAPDSSIVHISSSAAETATLIGENLNNGLDVMIPTGFSGYFIFYADTGTWEYVTDSPGTPELTAPTRFRMAHNTYQPIDLSWDPVTVAVKYKVYRWFTEIEETTATYFTRTIEGYGRYHVRAVDAAGNLSPATSYLFFYPSS